MAVFRVERTENYTVMSNTHLDDRRLSLKARGLLSVMLRLPEDWDYTLDGLCRLCPEGKAAIRSAVEELEAAGYDVREQTHAEDGRFASNDYTIYERPQRPSDSPSCENRTTAPSCDFPTTENCTTDTYLHEPSTNTPHKPPKGGNRTPPPDYEPDLFERLWKFYPVPKNDRKAKARAAWNKLRPDLLIMRDMQEDIRRRKNSEEWKKGIGIPHLTTYLNDVRRYGVDEPEPDRMTAAAPSAGTYDAPGGDAW